MAILTIVIPIIRFNDYSRQMMVNLGRLEVVYKQLHFLFAVSDCAVASELESYLIESCNSYTIYVANTYSSNALRGACRMANTYWIYFQDCDDWVDYQFVNDYCETIENMDCVYCFNVQKQIYDNHGCVRKTETSLFNISPGVITHICNLPTCVYSKIIPRKYLCQIDFPNLPYTQDWAISYQLYPLVSHVYIDTCSYTYNNYPYSSSQPVHDNRFRINRVAVYSKSLICYMEQLHLHIEADFLKVRYNDMLFTRYRRIGIYIRPYLPSLRLFFSSTNRCRLSYIYQCSKKILCYLIANVRKS